MVSLDWEEYGMAICCVYLDIRFTNFIRVWEIKVDAFLQELVSYPMAYPLNLRPPTVDCR